VEAPEPPKPGALEWKVVGVWDGRESFRANAGRGYYRVDAAIGSGERFYVLCNYVGRKQRSIGGSRGFKTAEEAKAAAQQDYEQGDVAERTLKEPQPMRMGIPL
jgi:hypothetical protein